MRRDDRDDPFDDFFSEIERMMDDVMHGDQGGYDDAGFGSDTHLDVQETDEEVRIIGDFPGIEKEDLSLKCDGRTLTISAATETREYDERLELPCRVDERSGSASYNNGVLEVTFDRAEESANIGFE
ncbi:HSP20 family protein [Halarchaeum rubridurum]|uniref:HSP20 family protein n=1 Tax=Halarchaeum rubridurum TaxID=489911 RepID=A0A830G155_9EURY|nr:Hsp20/alpha crystallin family protein [Halarchaeum rubridurum]MBP1954972.1 HSP20 family protein [Halarchaeum rubridurum]GGM70045.1 type III effector protein [Halarchaeum rubridurum]